MEKCCENIDKYNSTRVWYRNTTLHASKNGHLDCLKYAHENGCPWHTYTTAFSACNGHLDCLKYAHENDCLLHKNTTLHASKNGHLDCLKYIHENVCPLNEQTTLSNLEKCISKIDLDDKWWRSFLFEKDLTSYLKLNILVHTKKEEINNLQEKSTSLFSHISKDLTKYILWTYL